MDGEVSEGRVGTAVIEEFQAVLRFPVAVLQWTPSLEVPVAETRARPKWRNRIVSDWDIEPSSSGTEPNGDGTPESNSDDYSEDSDAG
ncbi:MAG: hypothetical protein AMXMBFR19_09270 [Chthonomonadaceae bacterium]|uniref:Uncharacterized protein n=1 Tax=Candidatus Nitrosymbiomonas proteolyticus TaxID=2608984 RepID=A0A809S5V9_9BACT|nr:hypothetical protein NPRO_19610 [Candidatus Nitrosymbiomonas proteolyticus]